jgi:hypothetical protein
MLVTQRFADNDVRPFIQRNPLPTVRTGALGIIKTNIIVCIDIARPGRLKANWPAAGFFRNVNLIEKAIPSGSAG